MLKNDKQIKFTQNQEGKYLKATITNMLKNKVKNKCRGKNEDEPEKKSWCSKRMDKNICSNKKVLRNG